jgi:hypothetical protein
MTKGLSAMELRRMRLSEIVNTFKVAQENDVIIDYNKFTFEIQMKYGMTEGKAMEYINTAKRQLEYERELRVQKAKELQALAEKDDE